MGSSRRTSTDSEAQHLETLASELGEAVAARGCVLVTGATTGFPDLVSRAARKRGGLTVGVSPASGHEEHVTDYSLPDDGVDVIVYTGFGLKGRNVVNVRSSDIVIIFGGGIGTLNEFTIAYDEGKIVGVLEGTGGAADRIRELATLSSKDTRTKLIFKPDADELIDACLELLRANS